MTPIRTVTDDLGSSAGEIVAEACDLAIGHHGHAVLAIPGGRSPAPVLRWLARNLAPHVHANLTVTFVDERHLPLPAGGWGALPEASNLRGAWDAWFSHRLPRVVPLARPGTLADAAREATAALRAIGPIDVVLLGFGEDGHVASLFPGHPALRDPSLVVPVADSPKPPPERLTLGLDALRQAAVTVVIGSGADKAPIAAAALQQTRDGDPTLPLALARPRIRWHWVLDPAAASQLPE